MKRKMTLAIALALWGIIAFKFFVSPSSDDGYIQAAFLEIGKASNLAGIYEVGVVKLKRAQMGKDWPFTSEEIEIVCGTSLGGKIQIAIVQGKAYALGGKSRGAVRHGMTVDIKGTGQRLKVSDISQSKSVVAPTKSLAPLMRKIRKLSCKV